MQKKNKRDFQKLIEEVAIATLDDSENFNGYSAQDLLHATFIFQYFLMDLGWQYKQSKKMTLEESTEEAQALGHALRRLIRNFTGLDLRRIAKEECEYVD